MLWVVAGIVAIVAIGTIGLRIAIDRNGPAVLSAADRVAGGSRNAERKAVVSTGAHPEQQIVIWGPKHRDPAEAPAPVMLFAHGGSWANGNPIDYGFVGRNFAENGFIVVLIGYRLNQDGIYPAMLEDTASAVAWTHQNIAGYGGDPAHLVLAGHSAGAYNVIMTSLEEQWLGRRGLGTADIAGVIALASPIDFFPFDTPASIAAFGHVEDAEATQPLSHVGDTARPTLLIHGSKDETVRPRNSRLLQHALSEKGALASVHFFDDYDHIAPLTALASPWIDRSNATSVFQLMVDFGREPGAFGAQTSVPVQDETG